MTYLLSFLMAFSVGANDAANGLGISYGTRAIGIRVLIAVGAVGEFIGAMFCAQNVTDKLAKGIINGLDQKSEQL